MSLHFKLLVSCIVFASLQPLVRSATESPFHNVVIEAYRDSNLNDPIDIHRISGHLDENDKLQNAVTITIKGNIPVLTEGAIKNLPKLEGITLDGCSITEIQPGAFQNLPSLTYISLDRNQIEKIPEGVFNNLPLNSIYLYANKISEIETHAFDNLPKLKSLHLNENNLQEWNSEWFTKNTAELSFVNLEKNFLTKIGSRAFRHLQGTHIEDEAIEYTSIVLSDNQIDEIAPDAFEGLGSLGNLLLQGNKLEQLDEEVFKPLTSILDVNVAANSLTCLPDSLLAIVHDLTNLDYSENPLTKECLENIQATLH